MANVQVTIDGVSGSVPAGSTVLEAARALGVEIPTLCDHPAIQPIGACRICLVEIEKQRVLQPACTFPVSEGMVVHTQSSKVADSRKFVLQLLFSERNHFCMFCQASGSCELQDLAYKNGLDHWEYDRAFPALPVDASRKYFTMDHNRCILCRRCIRACDELVGNATLGLKYRGAQTMVIADMDVPFGDSSCVSCGTCLQVCPVGALQDRLSAYMGATKEVKRVKSHCTACSVGCGLEMIVHDNRVIRVEGDWDAKPNKGLLCELGRFGLMYDKRKRVNKPLVKTEQGWVETTWEEALGQVQQKLAGAGDALCTIVSGMASTEAAQAVMKLPGAKVTMDGAAPAAADEIGVLDQADLFIVVQTDLTRNYQVAGFAIKRSVRHRGARLMILDDAQNGLEPWMTWKGAPTDITRVLEVAKDAQMPVIIYDAAGAETAQKLVKLLPNAKQVTFAGGSNARGLASVGLNAPLTANGATMYYVLAAEARQPGDDVMNALKKADYVVVQSSFREPWVDVAQVILPSPTAYEKNGTIITAEGRKVEVVAGVSSKLLSEVEVVERIAAGL